MTAILPFSDEQTRNLVNLRQRYEVWIDTERKLAALPYDLRAKTVGGREYLYEIKDRSGNGTSLGPMAPANQERLKHYRQVKQALRERRTASAKALDETSRLCRALRLPLLASEAGRILRQADRMSLLDSHLMVVGTNAMVAYAIEAGGLLVDAPDETQDFDMAWTKAEADEGARPLWNLLKAVDDTYTINSERSFQARNKDAYEVEILAAPSRAKGMFRTDQPRPVPLPEQEWLLFGRPVDTIVVCRDATPARIVAPDPRWFALQKLWLAEQSKRNPLKRGKDRRQGNALLNAIDQAMPQYPLGEAFESRLPGELSGLFRTWKAAKPERDVPHWT